MTPAPEVDLVLLLSDPALDAVGAARMLDLLRTSMDWNQVMGMLHVHRTCGVAWHNVLRHAIHDRRSLKPTYFFKGLEVAYKGQRVIAAEQSRYNKVLLDRLDDAGVRAALLKGAAVAAMAYPSPALRMFYDNDVLIGSADLKRTAVVLRELGYTQGSWSYDEEHVVPAPRAEILFMAVNSHQTHPYMLATPKASTLECHRLDLHFSVDLMTGNRTDDAVAALLDQHITVDVPDGPLLPSLHQKDMLLFSCLHFYKEAIHRDEVAQLKDLVLYKLVDVVALLAGHRFPVDLAAFADRVDQLGFQREVYFCLHHVDALFPGRVPESLLRALRPPDLRYLDEVRDGRGVVHRWTDPIPRRFFDTARAQHVAANQVPERSST